MAHDRTDDLSPQACRGPEGHAPLTNIRVLRAQSDQCSGYLLELQQAIDGFPCACFVDGTLYDDEGQTVPLLPIHAGLLSVRPFPPLPEAPHARVHGGTDPSGEFWSVVEGIPDRFPLAALQALVNAWDVFGRLYIRRGRKRGQRSSLTPRKTAEIEAFMRAAYAELKSYRKVAERLNEKYPPEKHDRQHWSAATVHRWLHPRAGQRAKRSTIAEIPSAGKPPDNHGDGN